MRPRWITIGTVKLRHAFMHRNWGVPNGLRLDWRGRTSVLQPTNFLNWREAIEVVDRRLAMAGLEREAVALSLGPQLDWKDLLVLVRRRRLGKWR